jgi:hypothetical protein
MFKTQLLTPEDGQFRPKHVVILKILKSDKVLRTLYNVLNIDRPHKDGKRK